MKTVDKVIKSFNTILKDLEQIIDETNTQVINIDNRIVILEEDKKEALNEMKRANSIRHNLSQLLS